MKKLILLSTFAALAFSSCLKDNSQAVDFSKAGNIVNFPQSGTASFASDALTADTTIVKFATDYATANANPALTVTLAVDQTLTDKYNAANPAITYLPMPTSAYTLSSTTVNIPAGKQYAFTTLTVYKNTLDPSQSYMLPIKIASASGVAISANQSIHYFHVIGNDFAGAYTWDYRRFQNGTGPGNNPDGTPAIPSLGQGSPPDISSIGQAGAILPVSPTEFQMLTGYNSTGVNYDVTFTKTVTGGVTTYSNWKVTFPADQIAKWTAAGIANKVPPAFTIPPPSKGTDPKIFELNYVSGGASGRYIDDTYHK